MIYAIDMGMDMDIDTNKGTDIDSSKRALQQVESIWFRWIQTLALIILRSDMTKSHVWLL